MPGVRRTRSGLCVGLKRKLDPDPKDDLMTKGMKSSRMYLDVELNIKHRMDKGDAMIIEDPDAGNFFNGFATGFEFPNYYEITENPTKNLALTGEACPPISGFDTVVTVPQIHDVTLVRHVLPRHNRHRIVADKKFIGDEASIKDDAEKPSFSEYRVLKDSWYNRRLVKPLGQDYAIVMLKYEDYPRMLNHLRKFSAEVAGESYAFADTDIVMTYTGWRKMCQEINPIWSKFFQWNVQGVEMFLTYAAETTGEDSDDWIFVQDTPRTESGHYEEFEYNVNDYLTNNLYRPNETYTNGCILALVGVQREFSSYFDQLMASTRVFFGYQDVKYGDLYWSSLEMSKEISSAKNFLDYRSYDLNGHEYKDAEITSAGPKKAAAHGATAIRLDVYGYNCKIFPVDTFNINKDLSNAEAGTIYDKSTLTNKWGSTSIFPKPKN